MSTTVPVARRNSSGAVAREERAWHWGLRGTVGKGEHRLQSQQERIEPCVKFLPRQGSHAVGQ